MDLKNLTDQELRALISRASAERKDRDRVGAIQLEDIKAGMSREDIERARQRIAEVLKNGD